MNPLAIVFWGFLAGVGYLLNDGRGALVGLVIGLGFSLVASFLPDRRR
jgi:hypothetical protein